MIAAHPFSAFSPYKSPPYPRELHAREKPVQLHRRPHARVPVSALRHEVQRAQAVPEAARNKGREDVERGRHGEVDLGQHELAEEGAARGDRREDAGGWARARGWWGVSRDGRVAVVRDAGRGEEGPSGDGVGNGGERLEIEGEAGESAEGERGLDDVHRGGDAGVEGVAGFEQECEKRGWHGGERGRDSLRKVLGAGVVHEEEAEALQEWRGRRFHVQHCLSSRRHPR